MDTIKPVASLLARIILGVVLIAHGWDKFAGGIEGTAGFFDSLGIPAASIMAPLTAGFEILGGIAIILGAATVIVAPLTILVMLGAAVTTHIGNGILVSNGGWELVGVIAAGALLLLAFGPGKWSVDAAMSKTHA